MAGLGYGYYATHPGEVLKDELEARGISQRRFAESTTGTDRLQPPRH